MPFKPWPERGRLPKHFKPWKPARGNVPDFYVEPEKSCVLEVKCMAIVESDSFSSGYMLRCGQDFCPVLFEMNAHDLSWTFTILTVTHHIQQLPPHRGHPLRTTSPGTPASRCLSSKPSTPAPPPTVAAPSRPWWKRRASRC